MKQEQKSQELDIVREGGKTRGWGAYCYVIVEVLHRGEDGTPDLYQHLAGSHLRFRYKKNAARRLQELREAGERLPHWKPPRQGKHSKYCLRYRLVQRVLPELAGKPYYVPSSTSRQYYIVEIDYPDALKDRRIEREYTGPGPEPQRIESFHRTEILAIIRQLNNAYWKEQAEQQSKPYTGLIDLRRNGVSSAEKSNRNTGPAPISGSIPLRLHD